MSVYVCCIAVSVWGLSISLYLACSNLNVIWVMCSDAHIDLKRVHDIIIVHLSVCRMSLNDILWNVCVCVCECVSVCFPSSKENVDTHMNNKQRKKSTCNHSPRACSNIQMPQALFK